MDRQVAIEFLKEQCRKEGISFILQGFNLSNLNIHVLHLNISHTLSGQTTLNINYATGSAWIETSTSIDELGDNIDTYVEYLHIANAIRLNWDYFYSEYKKESLHD